MKSRLVIVVAALCAMPLVASAQGIGIKAGFSYGSVPNGSGVLPGKLSPHSGVAVGVAISSGALIGFGVEGLYAQRGFTSSEPGSSQKLSYVDVPLYLRLKLPTPVISPFAYAGPQGSFELHCDAGGGSCPSGRPKTTFAGIIGAGAKLGMLGGLSLEGRYVYGLTDLKLSAISSSGNYQPRSFMLLAGIGF